LLVCTDCVQSYCTWSILVVEWRNLNSLHSNSDYRVMQPSDLFYIFLFIFWIINYYRPISIKRTRFNWLQCSHFSPTALNPDPEWRHQYILKWGRSIKLWFDYWLRKKKMGSTDLNCPFLSTCYFIPIIFPFCPY
jgi:hypothetical protein